jgi:hypothetical protein
MLFLDALASVTGGEKSLDRAPQQRLDAMFF